MPGVTVGNALISPSARVRDLGAVIDTEMAIWLIMSVTAAVQVCLPPDTEPLRIGGRCMDENVYQWSRIVKNQCNSAKVVI